MNSLCRRKRMKIDCISISSKDGLPNIFILLNSLKQTKQPQTIIDYRLIIEEIDDEVKNYFCELASDDFIIKLIELTPFKKYINMPQKGTLCKANYYTMVRCLCPAYFTWLDKALYLDTDLLFLQSGVEDLWNTNIDQYYMAGVEDIMINKHPNMQVEKLNCKSNTYINGGVMLLNLKKIRQDGLDQQLVDYCMDWKTDQLKPYYLDQSVFNYLFKDKTKLLDFKFNNYSLVLTSTVYGCVKEDLWKKYYYADPINSIQNAVILHFLGDLKPFGKTIHRLKPICVYYEAVLKIWQHLQKQLGKKGTTHENNN